LYRAKSRSDRGALAGISPRGKQFFPFLSSGGPPRPRHRGNCLSASLAAVCAGMDGGGGFRRHLDHRDRGVDRRGRPAGRGVRFDFSVDGAGDVSTTLPGLAGLSRSGGADFIAAGANDSFSAFLYRARFGRGHDCLSLDAVDLLHHPDSLRRHSHTFADFRCAGCVPTFVPPAVRRSI
jgi:hypothetical protein